MQIRTLGEPHAGALAPVLVLPGAVLPPASIDVVARHLARRRPVLVAELHDLVVGPAKASRALEDALRAERVERVAVVGHSYGFLRGVLLALSGRVEVTGLVGLGPHTHYAPGFRAGHLAAADAVEARALSLAALAAELAPTWFGGAHRASHDAAALVEGWLEAVGPDALVRTVRVALDDLDVRPRLPELECPTRLLVGEEDAATPAAGVRALAERIPDAEVRVLPGVGHFPHVEAPTDTLAALDAWIGR